MRRGDRRAASLLEVVLSIGFFLMISGLLFFLFHRIAAWRNFETTKREQQAGALVAGSKIETTLREVAFDTIAAHYPSGDPTNGDLILSSSCSRDDQGRWLETDLEPDDSQLLLFYIDQAGGRLLERNVARAPAVTVPATPAEMLAEIALGETRIIGKNVESFTLIHPVLDAPTQTVTTPMTFRIVQQGLEGEGSRAVERTVVFSR